MVVIVVLGYGHIITGGDILLHVAPLATPHVPIVGGGRATVLGVHHFPTGVWGVVLIPLFALLRPMVGRVGRSGGDVVEIANVGPQGG